MGGGGSEVEGDVVHDTLCFSLQKKKIGLGPFEASLQNKHIFFYYLLTTDDYVCNCFGPWVERLGRV